MPRFTSAPSYFANLAAASLSGIGGFWKLGRHALAELVVAGGILGLALLPATAPAAANTAGLADIEAMHDFAHCIIERSGPGAEKLLELDYRSDEYMEAMARLAKGNSPCLGLDMKISHVLLAGALAEEMIRREFKQGYLVDHLGAPEPSLQARDDMEYTALCMALTHPKETAELIYSRPGSKQADSLVTSYAGGLAGCVQQGQQLRVNKLGLRAIAALAAYRIALANGAKEAD